MVVCEIAGLAHAHRVEHPIGVGALRRILAPTVLSVAARTHVLTFEASIAYLRVVLPLGVGALGVQHRFHYLFGRLFLHDLFFFVVLSLVFRLVSELGGDHGLEESIGLGGLGLIAFLSRDLRVDKVIEEEFLNIVSIRLLDLVQGLGQGRDDLLTKFIDLDLADPLQERLLGLLNILSRSLDILA